MRTADQMYQYCKRNKLGPTRSHRHYLKRAFSVVAEELRDNEDVLVCFVAKINRNSPLFVYAISNQRIMIARKKAIGKELQTIAIDNVNDITIQSGLLYGQIIIDTFRETVVARVSGRRAKHINKYLHSIVQKIKEERSGRETRFVASQTSKGLAHELLEYKQLLEEGVISNEEFEKMKKELLEL